jgi:hypothetical protein
LEVGVVMFSIPTSNIFSLNFLVIFVEHKHANNFKQNDGFIDWKRCCRSISGILFANGHNWKVQRRFCLRNLRDFGFGKASMEALIMDEVKQIGDRICPPERGEDCANVPVALGFVFAVTATNVIWWLMASKCIT